MNKTELIQAVCERTGLAKKEATAAVSATLEALTAALEAEDRITLRKFGSFEMKERAPRRILNPATRELTVTPGKRCPVFRPCENLITVLTEEPTDET